MKSTLFGFRIASLVLVLYWILLFAGTHIPRLHVPGPVNSDKVLHFGAFTVLSFLMAWAIPTQYRKPNWNVLVSALVCMGYAAFDEFSQIPVGRTADMMDWMADCAGTIFGLTIYLVTRTLLWRRQRFSRAELSTTR